jgi:hypothetical protein
MKIIYIDSQNVHKALETYHKWTIDWNRFFVYLKEKYKADKIKIFFWYIKKHQGFYNKLWNIGFEVCFKETLVLPNWEIKWNVDIDIAINALKDFYEFSVSNAYLVTWDGDYNSLVVFWIEKWVFWKIFVPWVNNSSVLLKKVAKNNLIDLAVMMNKLQKKKLSNT